MTRPRSSGIFSGLALIIFGVAFLLHNYRGFEFEAALLHWWPVLLIVLGLIKLYERTSSRYEPGVARITAGEIFLVLGLLLLVGIVVGVDTVKGKFPGTQLELGDFGRNSYDYDLEVAPKAVSPNARITVRATRGDISVRSSDDPEIRVSGKKVIRAWSDNDAVQLADRVSVEVVKNGDGYEIHPTGPNTSDSRLGFNMEIVIPKKSPLTVRNEKGDVVVSDIAGPVGIANQNGDVDIRNTTGDVSIDT